jgi:hypothetical protein
VAFQFASRNGREACQGHRSADYDKCEGPEIQTDLGAVEAETVEVEVEVDDG